MKDKTIAYLLWAGCLVGLAGLHRIYAGKYGTGFLYLFTWGLLGFGQFIDLFTIPGIIDDANNRLIVREMAGLPAGGARGLLPGKRVPRTTEEFQVSLVQAAEANGGRLTVAEAVSATGRGFKEVERQLNAMAVNGYIEPDSDDQGNVFFKFPGLA